jgi:hypothetical protein
MTRRTLQVVTSVTFINYDRNMFIVHCTGRYLSSSTMFMVNSYLFIFVAITLSSEVRALAFSFMLGA